MFRMVPPCPRPRLGSSVQRRLGSISPEKKAPVQGWGGNLHAAPERGRYLGLSLQTLTDPRFLHLTCCHQRCLVRGIPGFLGLLSMTRLDSFWVSMLCAPLSLLPLVNVPSILQHVVKASQRLSSPPSFLCQFMPLLFLYCCFSEAWGMNGDFISMLHV